MAIHHPTPPLGGGERPRLPSAQVGPVTQAIRAMRAAEPTKVGHASPTFDRGIRALSRTEVEDLIGSLIDLLDAMDGDPDAEPSLGSIDATSHSNYMSQEAWNLGGGQDREAGDDNGIADWQGESEQSARHLHLVEGGGL